MAKIGLMLAASCLTTGLAVAQQGGDYRSPSPAGSETTPMSSPSKPEAAPSPTSASENAGTTVQQTATQVRTKELLGAKAVNENREVGKVDDLLVEENNAKVAGVVLSVGGIFGVGDKLVAIPWEQIDLIRGVQGKDSKPILYIMMTREQLEAAPYFEPSKPDQSRS
jgi:sporulation protein YlmC with PRC-barrel domain